MMRGVIHLPHSPLGPKVVGAGVHLLNSCPSVTLQFSRLSLLRALEPHDHVVEDQKPNSKSNDLHQPTKVVNSKEVANGI
jgi:hypothetical protein